jgi:hypothetical protein
MATPKSQLELRPAVVRRTLIDGDVTRHPESHYLDFVVDGQTLSERLPAAHGMTTQLNRAWLATVPDAVQELLGHRAAPGIEPGRVALLVCQVCGDLGCGALTATLEFGTHAVTWGHFAWETGNAPAQPLLEPPVLTFDVVSYRDVFAQAVDQVAVLPYDELAHTGRRFLWPWQWGWRLSRGE